MSAEILGYDFVDGNSVSPIGDIGREFYDAAEIASRFLDERFDVLAGLPGLSRRIAGDGGLAIEAESRLAGHVNGLVRDDDSRILTRGVRGILLPETFMSHEPILSVEVNRF